VEITMDFGFLAPQPGDQDYVPGRWVYLSQEGVSQGYLTKFDALSAGLAAKVPGGYSVHQVAALDLDA
jgi:hypothetical protein